MNLDILRQSVIQRFNSSYRREISNNKNNINLPSHYRLNPKLIKLFKSFNKRPSKQKHHSISDYDSDQESSDNSSSNNSSNNSSSDNSSSDSSSPDSSS